MIDKLNHEEIASLMREPFMWVNTASLENIPTDINPIIEQSINAMQSVYGNNGALYLHGSVVSGGFRPGSSDLDGSWFSYDELPVEHRDRRIDELSKIKTNGAVGYLDFVAMPVSELGDVGRKSQVFACAYNGLKVSGLKDVDFNPYLPTTKGDYFSCQYSRFGYIIELCKKGYELDTLAYNSPRSLAKRLARAIFHAAYLKGCPYEQGAAFMHKKLLANGYGVEAEEFNYYLSLAQKSLNDAEKQQIIQRAEKLVGIFDQVVKLNTTDYGKKVRSWLKSLEKND